MARVTDGHKMEGLGKYTWTLQFFGFGQNFDLGGG